MLSRQHVSLFVVLFAATTAAGCAATYSPPKTAAPNFTKALKGSQSAIINAAKKVLVLDGYRIASADAAAGVISTDRRQTKLTGADADCGTTMGIPYIKDNRTITHLTVGLVIADNRITIKTTIDGEYLKSHVTQSIAMNCISKGGIEARLFDSIKAQLP